MRSRLRARSATAFVSLIALVGHAQAPGENAQELRVSWNVHTAASPRPRGEVRREDRIDSLAILERRRDVAFPPLQRRPQVSSDQIVVTAVDGAGIEKGRTILPDPRIIRAEVPDATGKIHGTVLFRPHVEFLVTLPEDPAIRELRIHEPRWNGRAFVLEFVGAVDLE